ncbi:SCO7613 C-terminal domain-containing membrane protein, partial [Nocardioides sp. J9]|uniref:SCO7613 C-terminal domain-containing membrane protein n=1 Tax=Nocardioides sp. J9 TaxID=935844 RepID=UPI001C94A85C
PSTPQPAPGAGGVSFASVPKILLGLGAFCLLVAAVIFLAVSWSTLGVGGRTAVLGGFTLTAGASALLLHRTGLRIAGESLVVVALGLLALDVYGAGAAGWLGDDTGGGTSVVAGLTVAVASVLLALVRVGSQPRLVAPQVIAGIGLTVAYAGLVDITEHHLLAGHAITVVAIAAILLGRATDLVPLQWSVTVAGGLSWVGSASIAATDALYEPDLHQLWSDGSGWSLLVTAAAMLVPGALLRNEQLGLAGASAAAMVVTGVVTLPSIDTDATTFGLVALVATAAWVAALALLPRRVRPIAIAPAGAGSLVLCGLALLTGSIAVVRWGEYTQPFASTFDVVVDGRSPQTEPLLLVPSLLVVLAFVALLVTDRDRTALRGWLAPAVVVAGVGAATTLASYDVQLALPVAVLLLTAAASAAFRSTEGVVGALVVATGAGVVAIPSAPLTVVAAGLGAAFALTVALLGRGGTKVVGGLAFTPLLALAVTGLVHSFDGGDTWVAVPVLLAVGIAAVALPRTEVELTAVAAAVVTLPISLSATYDLGGLLALWLAVAGFLACATALVNESRRQVAWLGAALLMLATWVRLADLEVREPEAYTLPLAAALLALGAWRMHRSPDVGSTEALLPGLVLATVPTLLWALGDPVSLRALLLGAACLTLTVAGAAMRWSAPLLVGASVGAAIVLRELGPYAGDVPKWVWIGLAGALLTVVGITWERRLLELRTAVGFLGRLR